MKLNNRLAVGAAIAASALTSVPALAQATGPDLTPLTDAVDVSTIITAVLAVGAILVGLALAMKGARWVIKMVGR